MFVADNIGDHMIGNIYMIFCNESIDMIIITLSAQFVNLIKPTPIIIT